MGECLCPRACSTSIIGFLVKDKVDHGEIEIEYKPTWEMWSDMLTKPLQGNACHLMCGMLMNIPVEYEYDDEVEQESMHPNLIPKEEVGPEARSENDAVFKKAWCQQEQWPQEQLCSLSAIAGVHWAKCTGAEGAHRYPQRYLWGLVVFYSLGNCGRIATKMPQSVWAMHSQIMGQYMGKAMSIRAYTMVV